ncbi:MAG TPA: hypothetical protein VN495_00125 [Candidatus Paceibacterota bacterium]|nr:hypothetical protein [Candidatus Paceibacterota bacterium]
MKVCNTKKAIAAQLGSYTEFYEMLRARREHGGNDLARGEHAPLLREFVVLGRYVTDQFGQCGKLNRELFTDEDRAAMPAVMTKREYDRFFKRYVFPRFPEDYYSDQEGVAGMSPPIPLPPPHVVCARCFGWWALDTCHDVDATGVFERIDLTPYVGKTVREVSVLFSLATDALRSFADPITIDNPTHRFAVEDTSEEDTKKRLRFRRVRSSRPVELDHVIQPNDSATMLCYRFYHGDCFKQLLAEKAIEQDAEDMRGYKQAFEEVGFEDVRVARTPLPPHIMAWATSDEDFAEEDITPEDIANAFKYYRVDAKEGSFGIFVAAYGMLDIGGTGLALKDLEPEYATQVPPEMQWAAPFTGEIEPLLRLQTLLLKAKLAQ